jgi:chromosome segregation ATPase
MIPEELERLMQFILEQQAQFSVNMDKVRERTAESDERLSRIEGIQENTARQIQHLGNALVALTEAHERTRGELAESQAQTQESLRKLNESQARTQEALRELAESQAHSDRRLDALIDIVRGGKDTDQST